jgi:hypothetical protein
MSASLIVYVDLAMLATRPLLLQSLPTYWTPAFAAKG